MTDATIATDEAQTADAGETAPVSTGRVNGRFAPGNKLGPGRPKRGESVPEKLKAKLERHGDKVVAAAFDRMLQTNQVGNRALEDALNRAYGVNAQKFILQQDGADAAVSVLLQRMHTIDADYKLLPDTNT